MESHAKLFGHPVHPMLVVLPLGLFIFAVVCDVAYLITGDATFANVAYWNIAGGIVGGLLAAIFGAVDWWAIPTGTRAKAIGLYHGVGNVILVVLFAASWWLRFGSLGYEPSTSALTLSFAAIALGIVTSWLGGELVDRLGVGIDEGAHLNAPSSLSGPATGRIEGRPTRG